MKHRYFINKLAFVSVKRLSCPYGISTSLRLSDALQRCPLLVREAHKTPVMWIHTCLWFHRLPRKTVVSLSWKHTIQVPRCGLTGEPHSPSHPAPLPGLNTGAKKTRHAEFEGGNRAFISNSLMLQSFVNKRKTQYRFLRLCKEII